MWLERNTQISYWLITEMLSILLLQKLCQSLLVSDFSLDSWISNQGATVGQQVKGALRDRLFEELGLYPYLNNVQCQNESVLSQNGWINGIYMIFTKHN